MGKPDHQDKKHKKRERDEDGSSVLTSNSKSPKPPKVPKVEASAAPLRVDKTDDETAASDEEEETPSSKLPKIHILLDLARLETVKTRKGDFVLLNCDDHKDICRKNRKDPSDYRPDIAHQELLALIDSPLNKAGRLKVFIRTTKNVLIEVNPAIRIPRTYKRFSGLMVQLLHKMKIKAANSNVTLLKVVKNPFSNHLPTNTRVYGMSCKGTLYTPNSLASTLVGEDGVETDPAKQGSVCFIIGAMATGSILAEDHPYMDGMFSISEYPLSGACAISRLLGGIEGHWGIV